MAKTNNFPLKISHYLLTFEIWPKHIYSVYNMIPLSVNVCYSPEYHTLCMMYVCILDAFLLHNSSLKHYILCRLLSSSLKNVQNLIRIPPPHEHPKLGPLPGLIHSSRRSLGMTFISYEKCPLDTIDALLEKENGMAEMTRSYVCYRTSHYLLLWNVKVMFDFDSAATALSHCDSPGWVCSSSDNFRSR